MAGVPQSIIDFEPAIWAEGGVQAPQVYENFAPPDLEVELSKKTFDVRLYGRLTMCWGILTSEWKFDPTLRHLFICTGYLDECMKTMKDLARWALTIDGANTWRWKRQKQFEIALKSFRPKALSFYRLFTRDHHTPADDIDWTQFYDGQFGA